MSARRVVPILLLCALGLAVLIHDLMGKQNQTFDGLIVLDADHYEFYPNVKDCNGRGTPYLLVPDAHFREIVNASSSDLQHLEALLHAKWRARLNGKLSHIGRYGQRKNYWRELSVNYVVDAVQLNCTDTQ